MQAIQVQLSQKQKPSSEFLYGIFKICIKFLTFAKKK